MRLATSGETIQMFQDYAVFFRRTVTGQHVTRMETFFDECKSFLLKTLGLGSCQLDLIFMNKNNQAITFIEKGQNDDSDTDRERIIDLETASLLRDFVTDR